MAQIILAARIRESKGKGAARSLRRNQQVPAIFYGPNSDPVMLAVKNSDLQGIIRDTNIENVLIGLEIESESGKDMKNVMIKEFQSDPVRDSVFHIDFYEISMDKEVTIDIPIHLIHTPVGVTNGGFLEHIRRELTISAFPDKLIESVEVDVSGLEVGDAVHVEDILLPEGVTTLLDGQMTVAVVAAPTVAPEGEEEGAEEAEEGLEEQEKDADAQSAPEE
jgi:large subunit ribosomal protein L25